MKQFKYLFGPVPSRRFGRSLGVDLTPYKTCTLDCVFCQLGRTTSKTLIRKEYVPVNIVLSEVDEWLKSGGTADYITLSGSGEPTLNSRFGDVIAFVRKNTNIPVLLLTNGTTLHYPEVRDAACRANVVKVSLSSWDQDSFEQIHQPCPGLRFEQIIDGQKLFRAQFSGELRTEVFILQGINSKPSQVKKIAELAKQIKPDRVQLNTAVRPPAEECAVPVPAEHLKELAEFFEPSAEVIAEFSTDSSADVEANEKTILSMLQRRPCTAEQIADVFSMHINEVSKYLGKLTRTGQVRSDHKHSNIYYEPVRPRTFGEESE